MEELFVYECDFTRRSIRKYYRKDVEEEKIRKILEAGISALSEGNQRPWKRIRIQKENCLKQALLPAVQKMHLSVLYYAIEKSVDIRNMYKLI